LVNNTQCNETTGVYTFNATQNAVAVLVSYNYSDAANGKKISITNSIAWYITSIHRRVYQYVQ